MPNPADDQRERNSSLYNSIEIPKMKLDPFRTRDDNEARIVRLGLKNCTPSLRRHLRDNSDLISAQN